MQYLWEENIERENRGFIVHSLSKINGKDPVGYIKICYIPNEEFIKRYPTIWEFKTNIEGWCCEKNDIILNDYQKLKLAKSYCNIYSEWGDSPIGSINELMKEENKTKRKRIVSEATKYLNCQYGARFKEFKGYHVDRPYISFISVGENYRRSGHATDLFFKATDILNYKGLNGIHIGFKSTLDSMSKLWFENLLSKYPHKLEKVPVPFHTKSFCYRSLPSFSPINCSITGDSVSELVFS